MSDDSPRRWFRFKLRTLLVFVTLLCVWLGWQASIVHHRKQALAQYRAKGTFEFWEVASGAAPAYPGTTVASVPLIRRWLGDKPIARVQYVRHARGFSEADLALLQKVFPEAEFTEPLFEPCHPGCFPAGTFVDTPQGTRLIENLQVGDVVTAIDTNGDVGTASIRSVFTTTNRMWNVSTDQGTLATTETQPLCVVGGEPNRAGELRPGDVLLKYGDGQFVPAVVNEVAATDRTSKVFNLILDDADVFVAGGFLARSKPPGALASQ
jgi:hypothetical protein